MSRISTFKIGHLSLNSDFFDLILLIWSLNSNLILYIWETLSNGLTWELKFFLDKDVYKTLANKRSWFNQKSF